MEPIQRASPNALRAALLTLCEDEGIRKRVTEQLRVVEHMERLQAVPKKRKRSSTVPENVDERGALIHGPSAKNGGVEPPSSSRSSTVQSWGCSSLPRRLEVLTCERCNISFYENENAEDACKYHLGMFTALPTSNLGVERGTFRGMERWLMNYTLAGETDNVDGIVLYSCCGGTPPRDGCKADWHYSRDGLRRRSKYNLRDSPPRDTPQTVL